jgi:hypothetical protein
MAVHVPDPNGALNLLQFANRREDRKTTAGAVRIVVEISIRNEKRVKNGESLWLSE